MYNKIKKEWMAARIAKDKPKANLLTTLKGEIDMVAKNAQREVTDEDCLAKIKAFIKGVNFNLDEYGKDHTTKIIDPETSPLLKLKKELIILESFMPSQFNEEELECAIAESILGTKATTLKDMGKVMGYLKGQYNGQYDAGMASKLVKEALA